MASRCETASDQQQCRRFTHDKLVDVDDCDPLVQMPLVVQEVPLGLCDKRRAQCRRHTQIPHTTSVRDESGVSVRKLAPGTAAAASSVQRHQSVAGRCCSESEALPRDRCRRTTGHTSARLRCRRCISCRLQYPSGTCSSTSSDHILHTSERSTGQAVPGTQLGRGCQHPEVEPRYNSCGNPARNPTYMTHSSMYGVSYLAMVYSATVSEGGGR